MKILIAEDDASLRRALVSILQKNNYTVEAVDNGGDAFDYLCSGLYDAAILDIMMPVMDGVSVLVQARKENIATPVLLLTAKSEIDDKIAGLDAGANDYLTSRLSHERKRQTTRKRLSTANRTGDISMIFDILSAVTRTSFKSRSYPVQSLLNISEAILRR